jgi:hypothetical protein
MINKNVNELPDRCKLGMATSPGVSTPLRRKIGFLIVGTVLANVCYGASTSSSSVIPTSGDSIKDGDIIFFRSDAPIFTQEFQDSKSPPASPASPASPDAGSTVAAGLAKMAADAAADAAAAKAKADSATAVASAAAAAARLGGASEATKGTATTAADNAKVAATDRDNKAAYSAAVAQALKKALTQAAADASSQADAAKAKSDAADLIAAAAAKAAEDAKASPAVKAAADKATADAKAADADRDAKAAASVSAAKAAAPAAASTVSTPPAAQTVVAQGKELCAPMYSRFNVQTVSSGSKTASASPSSTGDAASASKTAPPAAKATQADTVIVIGSFTSDAKLLHGSALPFQPPPGSPATTKWLYKLRNPKGGPTLSAADITCNNEKGNIVAYDVPYEFTSEEFQRVRSQRMGFTWGGLVVPYKFYVADRSFQSNSSALGYVGYEGYFPGVSLAGIVATGPGTTPTTQTTAASPTSSTAATSKTTTAVTYTAATGVVATFGGALKFGLVVGWDWQGHGQNFKYEGKTWLALSIGAGF